MQVMNQTRPSTQLQMVGFIEGILKVYIVALKTSMLVAAAVLSITMLGLGCEPL
jgi:hypothetical protein